MFQNLTNDGLNATSKERKIFKCLQKPGPDLVIFDEGHKLKNEKTVVYEAVEMIETKRRIILTGTPLQNNLVEYHNMIHIVKPDLLGSIDEFNNRIVNPIVNGQYRNSTPDDIQMMKRQAQVLYTLLLDDDGCVQRRDESENQKFLPQKKDFVLFIALTYAQIDMYKVRKISLNLLFTGYIIYYALLM